MLPEMKHRREPDHDCYENHKPEKECSEKHKQRVGKATLELAVDISTDFNFHRE